MAKKSVERPIVEVIPSFQDGISAVASANAPFVYFDNISNFGAYNGIAHMTLIATRFLPGGDGLARHDHAITAHLRMNMPTLMALKKAIEAIENMNKPPEGTPMN